jgi:hypothetical protein
MRYLIFLAGLDIRDKSKLDIKLKELEFEGLKYIFTGESVIIHISTDKTTDELKKSFKDICSELYCWYFLSEFPEKMSCNLGDDDAKYLFDFNYDVKSKSDEEVEFDFNIILEEDEEDDDDDINLVQMLKDKYSVSNNEPTLDEILDKINQKGVSSLSFQEQAILKNYN